MGELLDMAADKDLIKKSGAWYSYGEERIGQGRENAKKWLTEHPTEMNLLMKKVRVAYGMDQPSEEEVAEPKDQATDSKSKRSGATKS